MEDAHSVVLSIQEDPGYNFFGVYDGHGGGQVAQYSNQYLHQKILSNSLYQQAQGDIKNGLIQSFLAMDRDMCEDSSGKFLVSGCTAVTVLIRNNKIYCANCGDSRACLSSQGQAIPLSFDHKPCNEGELRRIKAAGGFVEYNRVNGTLALSRALGDFEFKKSSKCAEEQMVTACPEVISMNLNDNHEFIVLACDGIWDVLSNQEVVDFIRPRIGRGESPDKICEALLTSCLAPDSRMGGMGCDNMTVTIVVLQQDEGWSRVVEKCNRPMGTG